MFSFFISFHINELSRNLINSEVNLLPSPNCCTNSKNLAWRSVCAILSPNNLFSSTFFWLSPSLISLLFFLPLFLLNFYVSLEYASFSESWVLFLCSSNLHTFFFSPYYVLYALTILFLAISLTFIWSLFFWSFSRSFSLYFFF